MKSTRFGIYIIIFASTLLINIERAFSGVVTTVPVSAEVGTGIAANLFPVGLKFDALNLFLTGPGLVFIDEQRLGMRARLQAYDHRPAEGIAESEMGWVLFSWKLGFDPDSRQVLLHEPSLDTIEFDRDTDSSRLFHAKLKAAWSARVSDPIRSEIPPHPYVLPFKDNIRDLSYDGQAINIAVAYSL